MQRVEGVKSRKEGGSGRTGDKGAGAREEEGEEEEYEEGEEEYVEGEGMESVKDAYSLSAWLRVLYEHRLEGRPLPLLQLETVVT